MEPTSEAVRVRNTGHPPAPALAGQVAAGVLGAGMLVMPSVVASLTGEGALLVWSAHLVLGATVSLLLALLVRTRRTPATLAGTVGALLGGWAARAVDGVFAVAFTAGQAAIAWFAATCLLTAAQGSPPRPGTAGLLLALALLVVAVAAALTPLQLPAAVLRLRPWAAGAVALACVAWSVPGQAAAGAPTSLAPPGLTGAGAWWLALSALFFAGVGWEVVTSAVPGTAAGARSVAGGVALGAAGVAVVHLGLAAVQQAAGGPPGRDPAAAPLRWVLAGAATAVLLSYCFTNVRTAARIAARLRPDGAGPSRALVAAVGVACCVFAWLGTREGGIPLLLLGPAAAAVTGYALGAVAAVRRGGPGLRCTGVLVLLALAATVVLTVPSLRGA
ncbi:amino acid:polyamine antiporter [Streptomyces albidoflavus]